MKTENRFGNRLKRIRNEKGLSQRDVAARMHISQQAYRQFEVKRDYDPKHETLQRLAAALDVSIEALKGLDENDQSSQSDSERLGIPIELFHDEEIAPTYVDYTDNFGANLRRLRKERGLTQKAAADALGIKARTYRQYETAEKIPKEETLLKLSNALNISMMDLTGEVKMAVLDDEPELTVQTPEDSTAAQPEYTLQISQMSDGSTVFKITIPVGADKAQCVSKIAQELLAMYK